MTQFIYKNLYLWIFDNNNSFPIEKREDEEKKKKKKTFIHLS